MRWRDVKNYRKDEDFPGKLEFRVRWRGFDHPDDDSWEKEHNVLEESALLREAVKYAKKKQKSNPLLEKFLERTSSAKSGKGVKKAAAPAPKAMRRAMKAK